MTGLSTIYSNMEVFLLILVRLSAFVFVSPVFGRKGVPNTTKIGFSFLLSYIVFFNFDVMISLGEIGVNEYTFMIIREALVGMAVGFISMLFFAVFYTAGQLADFQMGFNLGGMYDQQMQTKIPVVGNLFYVYAFLVFISLGGMSMLSSLVINMYETVPILGGRMDETIYNVIMSGFYTTFIYAVKMVMPLILLMLIVQFLLGVIIKFVPQMNVFIIGIPIKIILSLMLLILLIVPLNNVFTSLFKDMFDFSMLSGRGFR